MNTLVFLMGVLPIISAMIWGRINGLMISEMKPFKEISIFCRDASFVMLSAASILLITLNGFQINNIVDAIFCLSILLVIIVVIRANRKKFTIEDYANAMNAWEHTFLLALPGTYIMVYVGVNLILISGTLSS